MTQAGAGTGVVAASVPVAASTPVAVRFTPSSLDVRTDVALDTGRRRVFDALLHISSWWPHRVRAGTAVVLEPRVGGRFFENCDDGCGILLGHVSRLIMPEDFAIEGSLGIGGPVTGVWSITLDAEDHQRTIVHGRFEAFGAIDDETRAAAAPYWDSTYSALAHYLDA